MKTSTRTDILQYIELNKPIGATQIAQHFSLSNEIIHRHLKKLIEEGSIYKTGKPPKVYYFPTYYVLSNILISGGSTNYMDLVDNNFLTFGHNGKELRGSRGFMQRCFDKKIDRPKALERYRNVIESVDKQRGYLGYINAFPRFQKQFDKTYVDGLWLIDAYTLKEFGKSKLGNLAFYAKQSQSLNLTKQVIELTKQKIHAFVKKHKIDSFCFAPPSLRRTPQFMDELQKGYALDQLGLQEIQLTKIFAGDVRIPQKSIKGTTNRIRNAEETIYIVGSQPKAKRLLLIDDFVASGATVNICAKKIREKGLADKIYAVSLLGNIDFTYEVINEV